MNGTLGRISGRFKVAAAVGWRGLWRADDVMRQLMWGGRLGFEPRRKEPTHIALPDSRRPAARVSRRGDWRATGTGPSAIGVITESDRPSEAGLLHEVGRFFGLRVHGAPAGTAVDLLGRARREGWAMVALESPRQQSLPGQWPLAAAAYVEAGGTLFIDRLDLGCEPALRHLARAIGCELPHPVRFEDGPSEVLFAADAPDLTQHFAGVSVSVSENPVALGSTGTGDVIAWLKAEGRRMPAVVQMRAGRGRVVLSVGGQERKSLARAMNPLQPLAVLPAMMMVKHTYRESAWHAPHSLASFVIDDPALRAGSLGFDYSRALHQAREHGFHVAVATIPRELEVADPAVVDLLRGHGRWISACYHGSDHSGYEFFLPQGRRMRYRARSIAAQEMALERAVRRGEGFARRTGLALDRVMVFPHGVGPADLMGPMQSMGFLGACNFDDRYPLGAPVPGDYDLGLRPADLAWAGFPLIWRRGLPDRLFILDLFLGRPALTFGHPKKLGAALLPFVQRAREINAIADVRWTSLEDLARHSYLQRYEPGSGWTVSMTSNEMCLHNPDSAPRTYSIHRPHLPAGFELVASTEAVPTRHGIMLTVEAGFSCTVRVASAHARSLTPGRPCSLGSGQMPTRYVESVRRN